MRWIIGDIHGMRMSLEALVDRVTKADGEARFIFAGDYVNRGPDSKGVIDFLLKLPNARFCRGNHDDIFDVILNGKSYVEQLTHNNRHSAFKWFMDHGLADTFNSYGAQVSDFRRAYDFPYGLDRLVELVPPEHRHFVRNLEPMVEHPDLFVAHARWEPETTDEEPAPSAMLGTDFRVRQTVTWGRFTPEEIDAPKKWKRTGYFGHTPVDGYGVRGGFDPKSGGKLVPIVGNKIVLVDTACALSRVGRLSAFCADAQTFLQVDRLGNAV